MEIGGRYWVAAECVKILSKYETYRAARLYSGYAISTFSYATNFVISYIILLINSEGG